ncbi:MAG: hypothetical protein GYB66_12145 [Chloroflexi bacterium]|nr:hypothetical protein [Chloroflexota bacterium]
MGDIHVLVAVPLSASVRFRENLKQEPQFVVRIATSAEDMFRDLATPQQQTDVVVISQEIGDAFSLIKDIRQSYPRLVIIEVDEDADFSLPGQADEVSNRPFYENELLKLIKRLVEDRQLETLRADALPPVRSFAKTLMRAKGGPAKTQAAVGAIHALGYDYVAFFGIAPTNPPSISVAAQAGLPELTKIAPPRLDYEKSLVGWVAQTGDSKIVGKEDAPNHPFISRGRLGSGACVAVGSTLRFGVIFAAREAPASISQEHLLMMELIASQLASALARESGN